MNSMIEQFKPSARLRVRSTTALRMAGQIRSPSVSHHIVGWIAQFWVLALSVALFYIHPLGLPTLALDGSLLYGLWFLQSSWVLRDVKAGHANVWNETLDQAPAELVASVRDALINAPPAQVPGDSHFMLLEDPDFTPDQVWLVVGRSSSRRPDDLSDDVVIADNIEQIREWAKDAEFSPLFAISETELAVAQNRFGDRLHWDRHTRKTVQKWRVQLSNVRDGGGVGAEADARHFENKEERERLIHIESIGYRIYREAHPVRAEGKNVPSREEWIAEVRQLGHEKHDRELARLLKKMEGVHLADGIAPAERRQAIALAMVEEMDTDDSDPSDVTGSNA